MCDFPSSRAVVWCFGPAVVVVVLAGAVASEQIQRGDEQPKKVATEPYNGFKADQALLRKTVVVPQRGGRTETVKASSGEAIEASHRIFKRVPFLFRTREEVLELLGDPGTISDYNKLAAKDSSRPLVYIFDGGRGGVRYTIGFYNEGDQVNLVRVEGLE